MKTLISVYSASFILLICLAFTCSGQQFPADSAGKVVLRAEELNYENTRDLLFICKAMSMARVDTSAVFAGHRNFHRNAYEFPQPYHQTCYIFMDGGRNQSSLIEMYDGNIYRRNLKNPDYKRMSEQNQNPGTWGGVGLILLQVVGSGLIDAGAYGFPWSK